MPVVTAKSVGFVPVIVMPVIVSDALPVFESIATCATLATLVVDVKLSEGGVSEPTGAVTTTAEKLPVTLCGALMVIVVEALPAPRVSPFPAVFQDVSLVVSAQVPARAVADAVREGAGELLEALELFDVFTGPQIGEDRKSLTFALRFRAPDRTLTEDDASAARDAAVRRAAEVLGAELRA